MDCISTRLPYRQTGAFEKIALDYIDQADPLKPFFAHPPSLKGIRDAIAARKKSTLNREVLVQELKRQYAGIETTDKVKKNIESLLSVNTFTVTTAHQNNIFAGPLYFIYKIIHAIKLAGYLAESLPENYFVPLFYIGSEDADLEELDHIYLRGEKLKWNTRQKGAVGRMKIDKDLVQLISRMEGELSVLPEGDEIIRLLKQHYKEGTTIQDATFALVNSLFAEYGLVILLPDNGVLKEQVRDLFEDDLLHQTASGIVEQTAARLEKAGYKVQAHPREINLFYLKDDSRERIEKAGAKWRVVNGGEQFSKEELVAEIKQHPGRLSPNVILRGLYQERILPNILFVGGAGELAYWLQLKGLFDHYKVSFPVLVLRNSFLLVEKKWQTGMAKLGFDTEDFFLPEDQLINQLVRKETKKQLKLNGSFDTISRLYETFKKQASEIDQTLEKHVDSLRAKTVFRLQELEKKMLKAEKRKFSDHQRQLHTLKNQLFPSNGLQERTENFSYYYANWGKDFIHQLYTHSLRLEQEFVVLREK